MSHSYSLFRQSQKSFSSKEGNIRYIDQGNGPVILLLHGVPSSSWLYRNMVDPLVAAGYRVIAPDMLGFGSSDSPKGYQIYSEKKHADRLLALMNQLGIDQWNHVMHDAGGLWTWELLKKDQGRIQKMIILNTIILESGFHPPLRMEPGLITRFTMWLYRNGITTGLLLKSLFANGLINDDLSDEELEGYKKPLLEGKTRSLYYFFSQTCNKLPDFRDVLEKLNIPIQVVWGRYDKMLQWEPQREEVSELLGLNPPHIHMVEGKHFIQEEVSEQLIGIIKDHFSGASAAKV